MKNEDYTKLSLEELKKKEKGAQLATSLLTGIIIVQSAVGIYLTFTNGFSVFPILMMSYNNLKKIREEIASRSN